MNRTIFFIIHINYCILFLHFIFICSSVSRLVLPLLIFVLTWSSCDRIIDALQFNLFSVALVPFVIAAWSDLIWVLIKLELIFIGFIGCGACSLVSPLQFFLRLVCQIPEVDDYFLALVNILHSGSKLLIVFSIVILMPSRLAIMISFAFIP